MLLSLFFILLVTTALEAANLQNNRVSTLSSPQRKLSNTKYAPKENHISDSIIATGAVKSEVAKANDVIIKQEHNLLGVIMSIVTKLMEIKYLTLSDLGWETLSRLFAAAMSVIFGPNTSILWPEFAHSCSIFKVTKNMTHR